MIDLKPYPAMKDSGVLWLGEVPEHWEVRKLRHLLRRCTERNRSDLPLLSVVREKGVILRDVTNAGDNRNFIPDDLSNYKVVRAGQFAMNKMKAWQGSYGVSRHDGIVSPAYFVFDLSGLEGRFFHTAIRSRAYVPEFTRASDGVRIGQWDLAEPRMREIPFLVPPLPEQAAIVRFLDHADRRIRRYIRAKQKLIKLLEELKAAIIHRAVTRGLDPTNSLGANSNAGRQDGGPQGEGRDSPSSVRLKPSGVAWLGDVPEHWAVQQVRRVISFVTSRSRGWADYYRETGDIFVQSGNLGRSMSLDLSYTQRVQPPRGAEGERTRVLLGDVLVCITGALTGNVVIVDVDLPAPAYVNQHVVLVRTKQGAVFPRYLAFALYSEMGRIQFKASEYGGTKQGLSLDDIKSAIVPLPPITEQRQICADLEAQLQRLSAASVAAQHEIDLLREYRTRLIADVVTGKLDVREAAAGLPEVDPLDAEDDRDDALDLDAEWEPSDLDGTPEAAEA